MKKKYYNQFDSLRFFSIIFIMLYHYKPQHVPGGFLAVDIFFILSGFLMTSRLENQVSEGKRPQLFKSFLRRFRSIFIPLLIFIILTLIGLFIFKDDLLVNIRPSALSSLLFLNNWQQILAGQSYFAQYLNPSIYTHLWYLAVYFQLIILFYLYYALVRPYLKEKQSFITCFALSLLSLALMIILFKRGSDPSRVYYGTDTRCFSFLIGSCFAYIQRTEPFKRFEDKTHKALVDLILIFLLALAVYAFMNISDDMTFTYYGGMYLFDLLIATSLVMMTIDGSFIAKLFTFKPFAWLGRRSYGAYLFYYPVYIIFYAHAQNQNFFTRSTALQIVFVFFLAIILQDLIRAKSFNYFAQRRLNFLVLEEDRSKTILKLTHFLSTFLLMLAASVIIISAPTETSAEVAEEEAAQTAKDNIERNQANQTEIEKQEERNPKEIQDEFQAYRTQLDEKQESYYDYISEEEALFSYQTPVSFVGDSITLGASDAIYTFFPKSNVTANVGLQFDDAQANIDQLKANGQLQQKIVIALGSNGDFTSDQLEQLMTSLGDEYEVYLVSTHVNRPWREHVNQLYQDYVEKEANERVHLIDFNTYYQKHENRQSWLEQDGVHFNQDGVLEWVSFIVEKIYQNTNN